MRKNTAKLSYEVSIILIPKPRDGETANGARKTGYPHAIESSDVLISHSAQKPTQNGFGALM